MPLRTIPAFIAYEADAGGEGIPILSKGAFGEVRLAADDTTITGATAIAYRLKDGAAYIPSSNIHGFVDGFRVDVPDTCPGIWFVSGAVESYQGFLEGARGKPGTPGANVAATEETVRTVIDDDFLDPLSGLRAGVTGVVVDGLNTEGSPILEATDARYRPAGRREPTVNTVFKLHSNGFRYEVTRVNCHGEPRAGILGKLYADDVEKTSPGGDEFKIPVGGGETIKSFAARSGADAVFNATGWQTNTASPKYMMIRGPQIKDGIIYRDFEDRSNRGRHTLGVRKDGTIKSYMVEDGWSAAAMVADGVTDTFTFGPLLVKSGVERDVLSDAWSSSLTDGRLSARTIMGVTADHDIIFITVPGFSNSGGTGGGIGGNDIAHLAYTEGCVDAILLDSGGSTQASLGGYRFHPSSDSTMERRVPDCVLVYARAAQAPDSSQEQGPEPIELATGYEETQTYYTPSVIVRAGWVSLQGQIKAAAGLLPARSWTTFGQLPFKARPGRPGVGGVLSVAATGSAGKSCKVLVTSSGELQFQLESESSYIDLSTVAYDAY